MSCVLCPALVSWLLVGKVGVSKGKGCVYEREKVEKRSEGERVKGRREEKEEEKRGEERGEVKKALVRGIGCERSNTNINNAPRPCSQPLLVFCLQKTLIVPQLECDMQHLMGAMRVVRRGCNQVESCTLWSWACMHHAHVEGCPWQTRHCKGGLHL
jgi:hypothetical protein